MHVDILVWSIYIYIITLLALRKKSGRFDESLEMFLQNQEGLAPRVQTVLVLCRRLYSVMNFDFFPCSHLLSRCL